MAKYKQLHESIVDKFIERLFRVIGKGLSPVFVGMISAKDPVLAKKIKQLKKDRKEIDSYIKSVMKKDTLTKSQKKALARNEWPF